MVENKDLLTYKKLMFETYQKLQEEINEMRKDISTFLLRSDMEISGTENIRELVQKLSDLKIMYADKNYVTFLFDNEGFIVNKVPVNNFIEDNLPEDVTRGYYKLESGKLTIDYSKKRIIEEV